MLAFLGIIMVLGGAGAIALSPSGFGDIGVVMAVAGIGLFLSGVSVLIINRRINKIKKLLQ